MDIVAELKKIWKSLNINFDQVVILAVIVFIFGLIVLSFTFILPILVIFASFLVIAGAVYIIYKFLGGKKV